MLYYGADGDSRFRSTYQRPCLSPAHFGHGIAPDRRAMEHEVHRFHDEDETKEGEGNLLRCTEEAIEPGKKRRHRRNKAGVCLDCGAVSHRAGRLPKFAVE